MFVSDYVRFDVLYNYGGIYFDTDVEIIALLDDIFENFAFMGFKRAVKSSENEKVYWPELGLGIASEAEMEICHELIHIYSCMNSALKDGRLYLNTVPMFIY